MCQGLFFNKVADLRPVTLLTEALAQVFSCEFCEIFKNTFSYRTPQVAVSENKKHPVPEYASLASWKAANGI